MNPASLNDFPEELTTTKTEATSAPKPDTEKKSKQRTHMAHFLPHERVDKAKHTPVLKNLVVRSGFGKTSVTTDQMEEGLPTQTASLIANFLVETGFAIKEDRKYRPTLACIEYVKSNLDPAKARTALRGIIDQTWFASTVRDVLAIEGKATEERLINEMAYAAEVLDPKPKRRAFVFLLDYLTETGIIVRDESGAYTLGEGAAAMPEMPVPPVESYPAAVTPSVRAAPSTAQALPPGPSTRPPVAAPLVAAPVAPAGSDEMMHLRWPGLYDTWVKPDLKAVQRLKRALDDLEEQLEEDAAANGPQPNDTEG